MPDHLLFSLSCLALALLASKRAPRKGVLSVVALFPQWFLIELAWFWGGAIALYTCWHLFDGLLNQAWGGLSLIFLLTSGFAFWRLSQRAGDTDTYLEQTLEVGLGQDYQQQMRPERLARLRQAIPSSSWLKPFSFKREGVERLDNIPYGSCPGRDNTLDIYRPKSNSPQLRPVLLQIHGGGWVIGHKREQALPLMYHMAANGWVVVSINYRLAPKNRLPDAIVDTKQALAWIKQNIHRYGGDANYIAVTGGSAGGHLSSLLALTPNQTRWQPGFEQVDTHVQACVPFYGVYDFCDREQIRQDPKMTEFLRDWVMPKNTPSDDPLWQQVSPLSYAEQAPSDTDFMVIHGQFDTLAWVEEARVFAKSLRLSPAENVVYAELEDCQHAFEIFHSQRTECVLNAVQCFLEYGYSQHLKRQESLAEHELAKQEAGEGTTSRSA